MHVYMFRSMYLCMCVCVRVCVAGGVFNKVVPLVVADFVFHPCRLLFRTGRLASMGVVRGCVRARVLGRARQASLR